ncbi:XRE family transcriptional regulator [Alteromonadaceae bacterium M269]|nr:XRE family transcriptional regulator [Alteromonadaceae bacterium M269]
MLIDSSKLKQVRKSRGWSQDLLAKTSGLALRSIQRIEASGNASAESVLAICAAMDIKPTELESVKNPISVKWTRREIMQGFIIIGLFIGLIGSMFVMASQPIHYLDAPTFIFTTCLMLLFTALSFGMKALVDALIGIKYLFAQEFTGGKKAQLLVKMYQAQITFFYGAAVIVFLIGLVAIMNGIPESFEENNLMDMLTSSVSVILMPFLYATLLCEGILRPLKIKLENCDISL